MMHRCLLNTTHEAITGQLVPMRSVLARCLDACGISSSMQSNILLSFSELATNVMRHGQETQTINLCFVLTDTHCHLEIRDDGAKQDLDELIEAISRAPAIKVFDLQAESGRGFSILKRCADKIEAISDDNDATQPGPYRNGLRASWQREHLDTRKVILVVDDDPTLINLYQHYLCARYRILSASDGRQALDLLKNNTVDLVISDINMPNMNGIKLRDALNNDKHTALLPFIFLTMEENSAKTQHAIRMGIDDYLKKPVGKNKLEHTIDRVLTRIQTLSTQITNRVDQQISAALCPAVDKQMSDWQLALASRNTGRGGGDIVVVQEIGDFTYVVIADVMGHDSTAKFFSYCYAGYIKGLMLSLQENLTPGLLLGQLSDMVFADSLLSQLNLTCCVAELRPEGQIRIASAGHPAPLIVTDGDLRVVEGDFGMLPGLLAEQSYSTNTLQLSSGQRLALFTDGLFEAADDRKARQALENSVTAQLKQASTGTLQQVADDVLEVFDQHTKKHPNDDALLILMEPG